MQDTREVTMPKPHPQPRAGVVKAAVSPTRMATMVVAEREEDKKVLAVSTPTKGDAKWVEPAGRIMTSERPHQSLEVSIAVLLIIEQTPVLVLRTGVLARARSRLLGGSQVRVVRVLERQTPGEKEMLAIPRATKRVRRFGR